jgi:uncharacterized membrane protein required for colicin V production
MNWLDVVLVLIFAAGLVGGYRQGLLRQAMSLGAIAAGLILGTYLQLPLVGLFAFTYPDTAATTIETSAFLVAVTLLVTGLEILHRKVVPETRLVGAGVLDRVAGLLVSVVAVFLQLSIVVLVLNSLVSMSWPIGETIRLMFVRGIKGSTLVPVLYNVLVSLVRFVGALLPEGAPRFLKLM